MTTGVTNVDDLETTGVLLDLGKDTNTTNVVTADAENTLANTELEVLDDLASSKLKLDSVVSADVRVSIADGAAIVGVGDGNSLHRAVLEGVLASRSAVTAHDLLNAAELVASLSRADLLEDEATLGVVDEAESETSLLDLNDVHETSGVVEVSADLAIDLDIAAHDAHHGLAAGEGELEAVAENEADGKALTELVRTSGGTRSLFGAGKD